jgi:hypothetical protein
VDMQSEHRIAEVMIEIAKCHKDYLDNGCGLERPPPSLKDVCANWEGCMKRDARKVARASVSAKTFAMIFNSFVEEIGYKAMVCFPRIPSPTFLLEPLANTLVFAHAALLHPPPPHQHLRLQLRILLLPRPPLSSPVYPPIRPLRPPTRNPPALSQ